MQNKLLPCPFCGSEAERNLDYSKQIKCSNQNCLMSDYFIMTESSWNTRTESQVDRYKKALELAIDWLKQVSTSAKCDDDLCREFTKRKLQQITQTLKG